MVYLDHNATTPLRASARQAVEFALDAFGNASSIHGAGRAARAVIEQARDRIAGFSGASPGCVVFTSGGAEANALVLRGAVAGAAQAESRITRLLVSAIEHESVRANAVALAETVPGLKLGEIPVTHDGRVDLDALKLALMQGKGRVLVSVMAANNETGVLQDSAEIGRLVKREGGEGALFHVDAVQGYGRLAGRFASSAIDYMSMSAHKFGGPQGAGALIVREGAPLAPVIAGGGQESGRRCGTENVAAIAGFGAAAQEAAESDRSVAMAALRDEFERQLRMIAPDAVIFGEGAPRLPNTSNFAIPELAAETALIALDLDGVAVSSGSACSSGSVKPSHVLAAMGVPANLARCAVRVSFGWSSTAQDGSAAIASLRRLVTRRAALAA